MGFIGKNEGFHQVSDEKDGKVNTKLIPIGWPRYY